MSTSKCSACGYGNRQSAQRCVNCGKALSVLASLPSSPTVPVVLPQTSQASLKPDRRSASAPQIMFSQYQEEDDSPYQNTIHNHSLEMLPFEQIAANNMPGSQVVPDKEQELHLPFGFALFRPNLVGTVVHIEAREQINDFPNFAGAILAIIAEVIWTIPNVQASREQVDKIEVTRLRIQGGDGLVYDAMVRGSLRGANLSMGDTISLWGYRRRGNLVVRKGYDHTSRSPIATNVGGLFWPALLLLVAVGVLYLSLAHISLGEALHNILELPAQFKQQMLPFLK